MFDWAGEALAEGTLLDQDYSAGLELEPARQKRSKRLVRNVLPCRAVALQVRLLESPDMVIAETRPGARAIEQLGATDSGCRDVRVHERSGSRFACGVAIVEELNSSLAWTCKTQIPLSTSLDQGKPFTDPKYPEVGSRGKQRGDASCMRGSCGARAHGAPRG